MTHMDRLPKVAVITGGAQGIGAAIANRFYSHGAQTYILDKKDASKSGIGEYIYCDIENEQSISDAFGAIENKHSFIDVLCINAGIVPKWTPTQDIDLAMWNKVMAVNSTGVMLTIKHGSKMMVQYGGSIVVTGSLNSWKGDPNIAAYVASKHAALGIIRSAALDLGKFGVRVNGVAPGPVATEALLDRIRQRSVATGQSVEAALVEMSESTALGRLASMDDVVNTVEFLALVGSAGITGQLIHVDGGVL
jgi:NAD(P)-dependent dehydrogenase (short-subunit alcohol dehydrogenase family)